MWGSVWCWSLFGWHAFWKQTKHSPIKVAKYLASNQTLANGFAKKLASAMGYKPNSHNLPIFWSCLQVGHANNLVGLDGAQSKHTLSILAFSYEITHIMS